MLKLGFVGAGLRLIATNLFATSLFLLLGSYERLLAWRQEGHSIIAEIADLDLSAGAKAQPSGTAL
jgi:hypothetical protein